MKTKLTLEQHRELGARLHAYREQLCHDIATIGNAYPISKRLVTKAQKTLNCLDDLRCALDGQVFDDYSPSRISAPDLMKIYYPGVRR